MEMHRRRSLVPGMEILDNRIAPGGGAGWTVITPVPTPIHVPFGPGAFPVLVPSGPSSIGLPPFWVPPLKPQLTVEPQLPIIHNANPTTIDTTPPAIA